MSVWRIKGKIIRRVFCAVLCTTVVHNDTHTQCEQLSKMSFGLGLGLDFLRICFGFAFSVFFCFSLDCFAPALLAFVVL